MAAYLVDAHDTHGAGGFGSLWIIIALVAGGGVFALVGFLSLLFESGRQAGAIVLAFGGGFALGVVFGIMGP